MREKVLSLIRDEVRTLNEELEYDHLKAVSESTPLYGGDDTIDSLSLVRLVVGLEGAVEKAFGKKIILADEKALSSRRSPYRTAGTLADFVTERLGAAPCPQA